MNSRKFGETSNPGNAEPSGACSPEGVETRHGIPRTGKGIVQTSKRIATKGTQGDPARRSGSESYSSKKISRPNRLAGSTPALGSV